METLRAPRKGRPADAAKPPSAEPAYQRTSTPIYNALVREWCAAGHTAPVTPPTAGPGHRHRPQ